MMAKNRPEDPGASPAAISFCDRVDCFYLCVYLQDPEIGSSDGNWHFHCTESGFHPGCDLERDQWSRRG